MCRNRRGRGFQRLGFALAVVCVPALAAAGDDAAANAGQPANPFYVLDTKNLFGFLEGADIGEKGDRSVEFETTGSFGKAQGLYDLVEQEIIFENTLTDLLGLELGAHVLGQDVQRVSGLPDFAGVSFMGASVEFRYALIHRTADFPIQVTLTAQPEWDAVGDSGQQIVDYNVTFRAIADVISADRRLYGAVNLVYTPNGAGFPGQLWQDFGDFRCVRRGFLSLDAAADVRRGGGLRQGLRGLGAAELPWRSLVLRPDVPLSNQRKNRSVGRLPRPSAGRPDRLRGFPAPARQAETRSGVLTAPEPPPIATGWSGREVGRCCAVG